MTNEQTLAIRDEYRAARKAAEDAGIGRVAHVLA